MTRLLPLSRLCACGACDLLVVRPRPAVGETASCPRCGHRLLAPRPESPTRVFALVLTGLMLYPIAMFLPLMTLDSLGMTESASVFDSFRSLLANNYPDVALVVLATAIGFPVVKLLLLAAIVLPLGLGIPLPSTAPLLRWHLHLEEWGMDEVYFLGILVTVVKISSMARIEYDIGFWCFLGLTIISLCAAQSLDRDWCWRRLHTQRLPPPVTAGPRVLREAGHGALAGGILRCHDCGLLAPLSGSDAAGSRRCRRCGAPLHPRKPHSLSRTWALLVTAIILALPANLLPIMRVERLGTAERSTIMDGIVYFFKTGDYAVGAVIFVASMLVPIFKILGMIIVLLTISATRPSSRRHKTLMFHFIEFIGRWSLLDIFVIALLQALVHFGSLTSIHADTASRYFAGVVVATMLAAKTLDVRLLWDPPRTAADTEAEQVVPHPGSLRP